MKTLETRNQIRKLLLDMETLIERIEHEVAVSEKEYSEIPDIYKPSVKDRDNRLFTVDRMKEFMQHTYESLDMSVF